MKFKIVVFLVSLTAFFSCKKDTITVSRFSDLATFTQIELNSSFDVYLKEDTSYSIKIVGNEEVIANITLKIEENVLKIGNKTRRKWLSPKSNKVELYINSKQLKEISANETCNIKTSGPITSDAFGLILRSKLNEANIELDGHQFYYWNDFPCGGKLTLSGKTDELSILNVAIMTVDAQNLIVNNASIDNRSRGDCLITVLNKLEYSITGAGNIHLYGSPHEIVKLQETSSGRLIQH